MSVLFFIAKSVNLRFRYLTGNRNGIYLPRYYLLTFAQGCFDSIFNTAAARHFHTYYAQTFNIVICDYLGKFFGIVSAVELGTAYKYCPVPDKIRVEISVRVRCAVRRDKQACVVKKRRGNRHQLNLYRPL